ncbi:MAG TPA: hypothetical protein VFI82_01880 [Terriglobales bacterium]|jgi:hypothetical protein|nr:hypothetical protein [Terriglobales bacterium]
MDWFFESLDLFVPLAVCTFMACKASWRWARYRFLHVSARYWPTTDALVQVIERDEPFAICGLRVEYEYRVDGKFYAGELVYNTLFTEAYAQHFVERNRYLIHYDPHRPERSLLPLDARPVYSGEQVLI